LPDSRRVPYSACEPRLIKRFFGCTDAREGKANQFSVIVPGTPGVSRQGHLFDFIPGIFGGWIFRERRPKKVGPAPPTLTLPDAPTTSL